MSYKRRNYFIDKELQGRLMFYYFLMAFITVALFIAVSIVITSDQLSIAYTNQRVVVERSTYMAIKNMLKANWIVMLLGGATLSLAVMFISHRIAGPLFRFERTLNAMLNKDLSDEIWLRKKDEGKKIAIKINEFNKMLSDDLALLRKLCKSLEQKSLSCPEEKREGIMEDLKKCRTILESYRLKN